VYTKRYAPLPEDLGYRRLITRRLGPQSGILISVSYSPLVGLHSCPISAFETHQPRVAGIHGL